MYNLNRWRIDGGAIANVTHDMVTRRVGSRDGVIKCRRT